ncbi:MAG: MFS transporter [Pseudomonadota bacterium]
MPVGGKAPSAIPRGIWALGFVSLFMDLSSEMIHGLLPVFLVVGLGASALAVGLIEGIAEATASIVRIFSGALSDYLGRRKALVVLGYGLAAATKPLFPLAASLEWVFVARFLDRAAKGIRGAPRDALIADLAPVPLRGAAYGLRQSLDTVGAVAGPLIAIALMIVLDGDIRLVFWIAAVPAILSVAILVLGVAEPARDTAPARPPAWGLDGRRLGLAFWWVVAVGAVLTFARFSEAFLVLRAENVGLPVALVPLVLVVMSATYAASAYPAGLISDRIDRRTVLAAGFAVLIGADLVLAFAERAWQALAGAALWGLHMGLTQGLLAALVADTSPPALRGTAFGLFNLVSGVFVLAASLLAGWLWDLYGPAAAFLAGAALTALALVLLMLAPWRGR